MSSLAPSQVVPRAEYHAARPWTAPATTGALAVVGTILLGVGNPNTTHIPLCPLKGATGLDCPFCGGLRAVHSLTRADVIGALDHNLLFTVSAPALVVCWAVWFARSLGRPVAAGRALPPLTMPILLIVAIVFGVVRNLPAFAWLGSGA